MSEQIPGVLVAHTDGTVVSQNCVSQRLLGNKRGKPCWDAFSDLEGAEGLPCRHGCVLQLLADGMDRSQHTSFTYEGQRHHLSCVPVDGAVVCTLTRGTGNLPEAWQTLTPRERSVLDLLATGETTATAAVCLGLSEPTVRTHVENMRRKLGVNTRAAVVACGFRLGYLG